MKKVILTIGGVVAAAAVGIGIVSFFKKRQEHRYC